MFGQGFEFVQELTQPQVLSMLRSKQAGPVRFFCAEKVPGQRRPVVAERPAQFEAQQFSERGTAFLAESVGIEGNRASNWLWMARVSASP